MAARASTLTAFYTPPTVIRAMYSALERWGVTGGNILEPSMGVGAFFGCRPEQFDTNPTGLYGVEMDHISARIAGQLYQSAHIYACGYEKTALPDSFFDCAVGNVPFGSFGVHDTRYDREHWLIHDYFSARPSTRCARAVSSRSSPQAARWTRRQAMCGGTSPSGAN